MLKNSFSRLDSEIVTRALWTRVEIKLILRFMGQKEFQRMHWQVKVGFLYTDITKWQSFFSIRTSRTLLSTFLITNSPDERI